MGGRAFAVLLTLAASGCGPRDMEAVNRAVREKFPDVATISAAELERQIEAGPRPLLLDVRDEEEFVVSHLPGARRIEPGSGADAVSGIPRDREIVAYCSVGYRSAAFARELKDAGYRDVKNLEGSIFQWANEDRPLWKGDRPTREVHPYNSRWGRLLEKSHRAEP